LINLLDLPLEVQEAVRLQQISLGHAKVLKGLTSSDRQVSICREIIGRGLSVRATETLIKEQKQEPTSSPARKPVEKTSHIQSLEAELQQTLGTRVEIRLRGKDQGQIVLNFDSNDDFERLMGVLRGSAPVHS
jgi:ParB family chromosome partitioning protein